MKVICCKCGKEYEYNGYPPTTLRVIDFFEGNIAEIIRCPYCGLEHTVLWMKRGTWG